MRPARSQDLARIAELWSAITLHHAHLDDHRWFKDASPTAENVARAIFRELERNEAWQGMLRSVRVGEAPSCSALFAPSLHRPEAGAGNS